MPGTVASNESVPPGLFIHRPCVGCDSSCGSVFRTKWSTSGIKIRIIVNQGEKNKWTPKLVRGNSNFPNNPTSKIPIIPKKRCWFQCNLPYFLHECKHMFMFVLVFFLAAEMAEQNSLFFEDATRVNPMWVSQSLWPYRRRSGTFSKRRRTSSMMPWLRWSFLSSADRSVLTFYCKNLLELGWDHNIIIISLLFGRLLWCI